MAIINGTNSDDQIATEALGSNNGLPDATDTDDTIFGNGGNDLIVAGAGNDVVDGGDGLDTIFGEDGDDILSPGASSPLGMDEVRGGPGLDTLVLAGGPGDYSFVVSGTGSQLLRITGTGGLATEDVNIIDPNLLSPAGVFDVEQIAFGITAAQFAAGGMPTALVSSQMIGALVTESDFPPIAVDDTVFAPFGATQVTISIADLFANDVTIPGKPFLLGDVLTTNPPILGYLVNTAPGTFDPALYPQGTLVFEPVGPLAGTFTFQYSHLDQASLAAGNFATVTVKTVQPPGPLAAADAYRGTIGGSEYLYATDLLANDAPGATVAGLVGASLIGDTYTIYQSGQTGVYGGVTIQFDASTGIIRTYNDFTGPGSFSFDYLVADGLGNTETATVTITVDNHAPIAVPRSFAVAPGSSITVDWSDIVFGAGNSDPDGDDFVLAFYGFFNPAVGAIQGFGPVNPNDPTDFGSFTFTPASGFTGTASISYGIQDMPDLGGARRDGPYGSAPLSFVVGDSPSPPVFRLSVIENVMEEGTAPDPGGYIAFQIERVGGALGASTVSVALAGSGAQPASAADVVGGFAAREISFAEGATFAFFSVQLTPDAVDEPNEELTLALTGATFGTVDATPVTAIIFDDDLPPPVFRLSVIENVMPEGTAPDPGGFIAFAVERINGALGASTVSVGLTGSGLQPAAATDIVGGFVPRELSFAEGETFAFFSIQITPDAVDEPDEALTLALLDASFGTVEITAVTVTIFDDDLPPPFFRLSQIENVMAEGTAPDPGGFIAYQIERVSGAPGASTVSVALSGSGAQPASAADVIGGFATREISFAEGETFAFFSVQLTPDAVDEPDEQLTLALTGATFGTVDTTPVTATIFDDDSSLFPQGFSFSNGSQGLGQGPGGPATTQGVAASLTNGTFLIEATGAWNSVKNAFTAVDAWSAALGQTITVANFVDVRLDLDNAGAAPLALSVVGVKRGDITTAGGDDTVGLVFHSNEAVWNNTVRVATNDGNDTVTATTVALSALDEALLADNADPANGPLWSRNYDGRFSILDVDLGEGNDSVTATDVRLVANGGAGNDVLVGGRRNDVLTGGDGNDTLTGGLGGDQFVFDAADGSDVITDFSAAQGDKVVLTGPGVLALAGTLFGFGSTVVGAGNGHVWTASDFVFV